VHLWFQQLNAKKQKKLSAMSTKPFKEKLKEFGFGLNPKHDGQNLVT